MSDLLLSVVVPVYNSQDTLKRCLDSILGQKHEDIEVIIVDDGSTDDSRKICEYYKENDNRIIYKYKKNEGPGIARKFGIELSRGAYITFVDSDDYVDSNIYKVMIEEIVNTNADIVQCGYKKIFDSNDYVETFKLVESTIEGSNECAEFFAKQENVTNYMWNKVYRKYIFKGVVFPPLYASEDRCVLTQLYSNAKKAINISQSYYNYVMTPDSLCRKPITNKRKLDKIEAARFIINFYKDRHPDLVIYGVDIMCSYSSNLYIQMKNSTITDREKTLEYICYTFDKYYPKLKAYNQKIGSLRHRIFLKLFHFSKSTATMIYYTFYR